MRTNWETVKVIGNWLASPDCPVLDEARRRADDL